MNTAEYLNTLIECKEDMKAALIEKGVTPTGGLSTYADAIRNNITDAVSGICFGNSIFGTAPNIDTSNRSDFSDLYLNCRNLKSVPELDTSNAVNMSYMFESCRALTSVPNLECGKVTNAYEMFYYCDKLKDIYSLHDLGKEKNLNTTNMFYNCVSLTGTSVKRIIASLYDRATAKYPICTLDFPANTLEDLNDNDIAVATNKGWIIK